MQPVATITNITHPQIDSIIIWNDGSRNIAYAYHHGKTQRTTPLQDAPINQMIDETRGAFQITDGQAITLTEQGQPVQPQIAIPQLTQQPTRRFAGNRWN